MKQFTKILICLSLLSNCYAHHAMEFIELESARIAQKGEYLFHVHYDYLVDDSENPDLDHWEYTPGLAYGVFSNLMVDIHFHCAKFGIDHLNLEKQNQFSQSGPSPFIEAFAFSIQAQAVSRDHIQIGWSLTYETPSNRSQNLLGGEEVFAATLIGSLEFAEHRNCTVNFNFESENGEESFGYIAGARMPLTSMSHGIACGLEFLGDLENFSDQVTILPGIYFPISGNTLMKTGMAFDSGGDFQRLNLSLMHSF